MKTLALLITLSVLVYVAVNVLKSVKTDSRSNRAALAEIVDAS